MQVATTTNRKRKSPAQITVDFKDLDCFLEYCHLNVANLRPLFDAHEITLFSIPYLTEARLEKIGMKTGPISQILAVAAEYAPVI